MNPTSTSISNWERATKHVESDTRTGDYVNAETSLVFVGPPRLSDLVADTPTNSNRRISGDAFGAQSTGDAFYPVGLVDSLQITQGQSVQKMFEIGSRRSYQAGGRVQVQGQIARILFNGPSLLRVLYAYYPNLIAMANGKFLGAGTSGTNSGTPDSVSAHALSANAGIFPPIYFEAGAFSNVTGNQGTNPSSFFINLMSELFSHPFGLGCVHRDNKNVNYGAWYLEDCLITSHSMIIAASQNLITESVQFQADAAIPMEFSTGEGSFVAKLPNA